MMSVAHDLMQIKTHGLLHGELSLMTLHLDSQLQGLRLTCALSTGSTRHRALCRKPFAASPWPPFFQRRHNLHTAFRGRLVDRSTGLTHFFFRLFFTSSGCNFRHLRSFAIQYTLQNVKAQVLLCALEEDAFCQVTSDKSQSAHAARSNICQYLCLLLRNYSQQCNPM